VVKGRRSPLPTTRHASDKAALGFSRSVNVLVEELGRKDYDGRP